MTKPYHQMTPAEQLAERITRNREIAERAAAQPVVTKSAKSSRAKATAEASPIATRRKAVAGALDEFQQIKKSKGIDAASDFVLSRIKK
jgi:hypothetical protein